MNYTICAACEYRTVCKDVRDYRKKCRYWVLDEGKNRTPEDLRARLKDNQSDIVKVARAFLGVFGGALWLACGMLYATVENTTAASVLGICWLIGLAAVSIAFVAFLVWAIVTLIRKR